MADKREEYQELFRQGDSWYTEWGEHGQYGGRLFKWTGGLEIEIELADYGLNDLMDVTKLHSGEYGKFNVCLCREEARDIAAMLNAMVDELERRDQEKAERAKLERWNKQAS